MSQQFLDLIDAFISQMGDCEQRDLLVARRNAYCENPQISELKTIRLMMREYIRGDRFVFDRTTMPQKNDNSSKSQKMEGYYFDGEDEEAEEFADLDDTMNIEIDPDDFKESKVDLEGFSFTEDSASDRFLGVSYREVVGDSDVGYVEDDDIPKGRMVPPISLADYPELPGMEDPVKTIGIDVAAMGSDRTWFVFRHGIHVVDIWTFSHRDPMEVCGFVMKGIEQFEPDEIIIDITGGLGFGVSSRLEELGVDEKCTITTVIFNAKPRDPSLRCRDQRAEMYYLLKDRFLKGEITLPPHRELLKEIAYITYEMPSDGSALMISKKSKIKKELQRSPDGADALAMAFYNIGGLEVY